MFETIFNLIKLYSKSVRSSQGKQFIKDIKKDIISAYDQNVFISFTIDNIEVSNCISKTLTKNKTLTEKKPNLKLEKISIVEKGKEITR